MFVGIVFELVRAMRSGESLFGLICDPNNRYNRGPIYFWIWIFHLSKFYELLDTVFIILRNGPIIFLHVYHHVMTLFITWFGLYTGITFQWFGLLLNTFVHIFMYYYYAKKSLGLDSWWKVYLTRAQILQFIVNLSMVIFWGSWENTYDCSGNWLGIGITAFANLTFLLLFFSFHFFISFLSFVRYSLR